MPARERSTVLTVRTERRSWLTIAFTAFDAVLLRYLKVVRERTWNMFAGLLMVVLLPLLWSGCFEPRAQKGGGATSLISRPGHTNAVTHTAREWAAKAANLQPVMWAGIVMMTVVAGGLAYFGWWTKAGLAVGTGLGMILLAQTLPTYGTPILLGDWACLGWLRCWSSMPTTRAGSIRTTMASRILISVDERGSAFPTFWNANLR